MTERQIKEARETLPQWQSGVRTKLTKEEKTLDQELNCRSMINSCLVYGQAYSFYDKQTNEFGRYSEDYRKQLGDDRVLEIFEEQQADFAKATVRCGVYEDHEGCSYNSCRWGDEDDAN